MHCPGKCSAFRGSTIKNDPDLQHLIQQSYVANARYQSNLAKAMIPSSNSFSLSEP